MRTVQLMAPMTLEPRVGAEAEVVQQQQEAFLA